MVDQALLDKMKSIVDDPSAATLDDIKHLLEFSKQISKENDDIKEELEDMDIVVQMIITDKDAKFWLKAQEGEVDVGEGDVEDPSFTFSASFDTAIGMLTGEIDSTSAYMAGEITVEGNLQDAMAFQELNELVMEAYEDLTE
ncbi:MAG: SCP2 sterol-binding domain-containing protein [Candidatus Lokiarchaeota archaeon]|nr:SCP2 sterol-binding domain-containing protein [Candidatus Lokiarchaeota archaeon]